MASGSKASNDAIGVDKAASVGDELLGEEVLRVVQRLRDRGFRDPVHAGEVDVADAGATSGGVGVDVGGEVGAQGEHRGGGREEDVARDAVLPGDGEDDGRQDDVRDERGRASAGEERAEQRRGAAHGLEAEEERVGVGELGLVERRQGEVEPPDARARRGEERVEETVGSTAATETSQPWAPDSATARRPNGTRWPMPALGRRTTCGRVAPVWSPEVGISGEAAIEHLQAAAAATCSRRGSGGCGRCGAD
nr:unnamed protein product [Digitaria exilis]